MKKIILVALFVLCFWLPTSVMASIIPQDYSCNNGGMTQWESDLFFFKLNYPKQMELYRANISTEEANLAKAARELNTLSDQLAKATSPTEKGILADKKNKASQSLEEARRAILLLMAEIEKTDEERVYLESRADRDMMPAPVFEAGQYQAEADYLLNEQYIKPTDGVETSQYGYRIHPVTGQYKLHEGLDLANWEGTPILAAKSGIVKYAGYNDISGNNILIRHYDGQETSYFHMVRLIAKQGEYVSQGDKIGEMGTTGRSTGTHLHFEIRINGTPVDPAPYVYHHSREERR